MILSFVETLAAPPSALFAILSEPRRRPEWQSSLQWVRVLSEGPTQVGTRWRERLRLGLEFELEIVEHEAPSRWAERVKGRWGNAVVELSFEPAAPGADQTQLGVNLRISPPAWWHTPLKALAPAIRRLLGSDLRRAADLAQSASASTPSQTEPAQ